MEYKPKTRSKQTNKKLIEIDEIEENEISAGKWALKSENRKSTQIYWWPNGTDRSLMQRHNDNSVFLRVKHLQSNQQFKLWNWYKTHIAQANNFQTTTKNKKITKIQNEYGRLFKRYD